jgi:hypothetical protein
MEGGCWIKVKAELEVQDLFLAEDDCRKSDMEIGRLRAHQREILNCRE